MELTNVTKIPIKDLGVTYAKGKMVILMNGKPTITNTDCIVKLESFLDEDLKDIFIGLKIVKSLKPIKNILQVLVSFIFGKKTTENKDQYTITVRMPTKLNNLEEPKPYLINNGPLDRAPDGSFYNVAVNSLYRNAPTKTEADQKEIESGKVEDWNEKISYPIFQTIEKDVNEYLKNNLSNFNTQKVEAAPALKIASILEV